MWSDPVGAMALTVQIYSWPPLKPWHQYSVMNPGIHKNGELESSSVRQPHPTLTYFSVEKEHFLLI